MGYLLDDEEDLPERDRKKLEKLRSQLWGAKDHRMRMIDLLTKEAREEADENRANILKLYAQINGIRISNGLKYEVPEIPD